MSTPYVIVLGTAQDGGFPHIGCQRKCCAAAWDDPALRRNVACLGIVDPASSQCWMIDCTPDFPRQLRMLTNGDAERPYELAGLFLTHAHIGHYTGLSYFGREALNSANLPVHVMPRMREFLSTNEPWRGLVRDGHVQWRPLADGEPVSLAGELAIEPFVVPHRDELSETVGYRIVGPAKTVAWLPDIDGWQQNGFDVMALIHSVDVAYLDGTFFDADELPQRSTNEVPHPTIRDSLALFDSLTPADRAKVRFVHFNHTNPVLDEQGPERAAVVKSGAHIADDGERILI